MRTVELGKVVVAAEALRLRRIARRQAMRAAFGAGAAVFAIGVLIVLHVLIYVVARFWLAPIWAVLIVLAVDVIVAAILGFLATRNASDAVQLEAEQIKAQAIAEMKRSLTVMSMAAEVGGLVMRSRTRAGVRQSVANVAAEMASRLIGR